MQTPLCLFFSTFFFSHTVSDFHHTHPLLPQTTSLPFPLYSPFAVRVFPTNLFNTMYRREIRRVARHCPPPPPPAI